MNRKLRQLTEELDGGQIGRREFLRKTAVVTGGTATGLGMLPPTASTG